MPFIREGCYNNDKAYEELVAAMEAMKLLELPHIAQLERDQDYPIDVIMAGLTLARHASEGAEGQPDYFLKPDVAQLQVPIFARPRDILNPFALEREIPLKESLEAHAIRLAKKKGLAWRLCYLRIVNSWGSLRRLEMLHTKLAGQSKGVVTASRLSSLCKLIVFVYVGKF
ncbi:hypothetical protein Tco_0263513, partial [Tanacetum coccineum]